MNERNNATTDIIMGKMHENLPNVDENTALRYAVSVNCCLYLFVDPHLLNYPLHKIQSYCQLFMILYQC